MIGRQFRERGFREMMIKCKWTVWVCALLWMSVTPAFAEVTQAQIDQLLAGQKAILDELAQIRQRIEPKTADSRVSDTGRVVNVANSPTKGRKDAPLTIIEYTDYQCPYCARHVRSILPKIQKNYIDTGKVRYVLKDFPLSFHKLAAKAGEAGHCAGEQGKYWEMHDLMFENQKALGRSALMAYAEQLGVDRDAFEACVDSARYAGRVAQSLNAGQMSGISGTPSFVIGYSDGDSVKSKKLLRGAVGFSIFQSHLDALLDNDLPRGSGGGV